jgi:hypothetical protein
MVQFLSKACLKNTTLKKTNWIYNIDNPRDLIFEKHFIY